MYYRLENEPSLNAGYLELEANGGVTLIFGEVINKDDLILPYPFTIRVNPRHRLEMNDFYPDRDVMSKRLVATLQSSGVDNLQIFPAEIKHNLTGEIIDDFVVVNIIGMVSCADLSKSDAAILADVKYFHKLTIDPNKTGGALMFRLAESRIDVVVAEQVAKAIEKGNFHNLILEPIEEITC
jgi:hypothetical protein